MKSQGNRLLQPSERRDPTKLGLNQCDQSYSDVIVSQDISFVVTVKRGTLEPRLIRVAIVLHVTLTDEHEKRRLIYL